MWAQYKDQIVNFDNTTDIKINPDTLIISTYYAGADCCRFQFDNQEEYDTFLTTFNDNKSWIRYKNQFANLDNTTDLEVYPDKLLITTYYGGIECCKFQFDTKDEFDMFMSIFSDNQHLEIIKGA